MGKSRAPKVNVDGLCNCKANTDRPLETLRNRFLQFQQDRQAEKLGTPYIALDAMEALPGAKREGYSDAKIRACWPETWGVGEVTVPVSLLQVIGQAWVKYKDDVPGKTFDEVLGLAGGGQGKQRRITTQKKRDKHRQYGNEVAILYTATSDGAGRMTLAQAIEAVANAHNVNTETVEAAYKTFGRPLLEAASAHNLTGG